MDQRAMVDEADAGQLADQAGEFAALYRLTDRLYRAASLDRHLRCRARCAVGRSVHARLGSAVRRCRRDALRRLARSVRSTARLWRDIRPGSRRSAIRSRFSSPTSPEPTSRSRSRRRSSRKASGRSAFIPLMAQGKVVGKFMTYYDLPRPFTEHDIELAVTIARQVGFSLERARAERRARAAEEELRESEERFRLMSEHAPVMIWMSDAQGSACISIACCALLGRRGRKLPNFNWQTRCIRRTRRDRPADDGSDGRATSVTINGRYTMPTALSRAADRCAAALLGDGRVPRHDRCQCRYHRARARCRSQRELLLAELNHRVKNTLAVVQGIAQQTFKDNSPDPTDARRAFEGRADYACGRA